MLKGISIGNFKGISQSSIKDFNLINIFIGGFGSDKSTILDAIYLLRLSSGGSDCFKKIMSRRTRRTPDLSSLWYNYETDRQASIAYALESSTYEISLNPDEKLGPVRLQTTADGAVSNAGVNWNGQLLRGEPKAPVGKEELYAKKITFLDSEMLGSVMDAERQILDPMKAKLLDHKLMEIFNEAFPTCKDYGFHSASPRQQQESRCYLDFGDSRVLIDDISDGLRNGLIILSTVCMLTDTALLLEEPENNMYPKDLDKLLEGLVRACKSNRVQLFVTTHRPEVLASLIEYGQEMVTIFHFSRKDGEVRARPSQWNDTRILVDLGWDVGRLVKGYERYVIVEGDTDKLVLDESFRKKKGVLPEHLWMTIIPARGLDRNFNVLLKALLPTGREIFALPDLDKKSLTDRRSQLVQSVRQLESEGYDVREENDAVIVSEKGMTTSLKPMSIIPLGDQEGLLRRGFPFESFSMNDYLLETILDNPNTWNSLGITQEVVVEAKKCKNSKSVFEDVMKMNNDKIRTLIKDSTLSDGLVQIVKKIAGDA